ncbi:sensor histidine kinase [Brevundimonas diminuta]|uniref:sensor histidine kinase n=1 Tax=Brevundimonas diminuta TaxID=293 RepID=UPI00320B14D8
MKPRAALLDPIRRPEAHDAGDGAAVAAWHAAWAAAVGATALTAAFSAGGGLLLALAVMAAPGLAGLALLRRDDDEARSALMVMWALSALTAATLSGGAGGPLPGFIFAPLAAGLALGGRRRVQVSAVAVVGAAAAGLLSGWLLGPPASAPLTAGVSMLASAAAACLALMLGARRAARRLNAAQVDVAGIETLLAGQPGLTLLLDADGAAPGYRARAAYGAAPAALPVDLLFGEGLLAAVDEADHAAVLTALTRARNGAEAQVRFTPRLALDRRILLVARRLDGPGTADGSRLIVQALDATLQHAREAELDAARAEAEAQSAGKTRFLAHMSHELRTPLNAVIGFSDAMRQELFGPVPPRYADYARSIHEAGGHLLDLINDVLDVSRIEADRYQLSLERFDAREPVLAALALVRIQADDKGVELAAVLPPEALSVRADRRALKQMTLNLLANAVKFTPSGGTVTVSVQAADDALEVTVADTGVGIPAEDLARLGRPYEQAGDAEQRAQGSGLGLALVRALAGLHGGTLTLDSTPGVGTAATVRLPLETLDA